MALRLADNRNIRLGIGLPLAGTQRDDDFWLSFIAMEKPDRYTLYVPDNPIGEFAQDIAHNRNDLIRQAKRDKMDYFIMLDTDQIYHQKDTITKLLKHALSGKDVVIGPVHRRYDRFELLLKRGEPGKYYDVPDEEKYSGDLIEIDAAGTGCVLYSMKALLDIPAPWFELSTLPNGKPLGEDYYLCSKLRKAGYRIWADTSIEIDHIARIRINRGFYEAIEKQTPKAKEA